MTEDTIATNPYAPPQVSTDGLVKRRRIFQIGREEIYTIIIETSLLTGLKTHAIDSAGNSTPTLRGTCRFHVGQKEEHDVAVELDEMKRVNLLINDKLLEENLFPRMHTRIISLSVVFLLVLTIVAIIGAIAIYSFPIT